MQDVNVAIGVIAFVALAGVAAVAWFRHGRDPFYLDDSSVLLPAPPPGMTAATATVVAGGGPHVAFMAALLDLASRDEIAFVPEGRDARGDRVGIVLRGGETADPRVQLNRRNPIGEGESWLLGELRAWPALAARHGTTGDEPPPPELMAAGMQMMATLMRARAATVDGDDSPAARAAREHGLASVGMPDFAALERVVAARSGEAMPDDRRLRMEQVFGAMSAFSDPRTLAHDPDRYIGFLEANRGHPLSPQEREQARAQLAAWAGRSEAAGGPRTQIAAADARRLPAPFLFGTLLQSYAKRHGWIAGLAFLASLRWYVLGAAEIAVGLTVALLGDRTDADPRTWLGGGIAAAGVATFLIGRAMPALSLEGAMMKAQLAAYRRTLAMTFDGASSLDEVVASHRLPWLETPDQTLVWGVALGLRREIEALLSRTAHMLAAAAPSGAYVPAWYGGGVPTGPGGGPPGTWLPAAVADPAAMFAGIEAIGSEANAPSRPA